MEEAYLEYQKEYTKRQNEVCTRLLTMAGETRNKTYSQWLLDAVSFIQKEKN